MAVHYSNFGVSGCEYADQRGFIPQAGDNIEDFVFEEDPYGWKEHIEAAEAWIAREERRIEAWRRGGGMWDYDDDGR